MRRIFVGLCCVGALLFGADLQAENVACFDWDCDGDPTTRICVFDASCSVITDGMLWKYRWNFGDNPVNTLTGSPVITHQYSLSYPYPTVELTLVPYNAPLFGVSCGIVVYNSVGPPRATYGQCSE